MAEKLKSEGVCVFCDKTYAQRSINRHLSTHLKKLADENKKRGKSFLVYVRANEMFLSLWVDANMTFDTLDNFLRQIWLDCCGHMSAFIDPNGYYEHPSSGDDWMMPNEREVPMNYKVGKVFSKGKKLEYEYDFGSTTILDIEVKEEFAMPANKKMFLLSRNEPLKILCNNCNKKPASEICSVHVWEGEGFLCESCAEGHAEECEDFDEYGRMPVVNSPRMGVCAYNGGVIDTKRDGAYGVSV